MKIVVSVVCHSAGIACALKTYFPRYTIIPLPIHILDDKQRNEYYDILKDSDIWITSGSSELVDDLNIQVLRVPVFQFLGFHPDLCYATCKRNGDLIQHHYNSRIAIWAYNRSINVYDAVKLYNERVYNALGYFDCWDSCVSHSRKVFIDAGWTSKDFDTFFLEAKRLGNFMHGVNHPNNIGLSIMAKLIAKKIDGSIEYINAVIPDTLTSDIWPLYPEIGSSLGLSGSYSWRLYGDNYNNIIDYLIFAYRMFMKQDLMPGNIDIVENICHDSVFSDSETHFLVKELTI